MLVLKRNIGEKIIINGVITVTVLSTKGYQVRIGVDAPSEIPVHREEIYQRIQAEKQLGAEKEVEEVV